MLKNQLIREIQLSGISEKKLFLDLNTSKFGEMAIIEGPQRTSGLISMFGDFRKFK